MYPSFITIRNALYKLRSGPKTHKSIKSMIICFELIRERVPASSFNIYIYNKHKKPVGKQMISWRTFINAVDWEKIHRGSFLRISSRIYGLPNMEKFLSFSFIITSSIF